MRIGAAVSHALLFLLLSSCASREEAAPARNTLEQTLRQASVQAGIFNQGILLALEEKVKDPGYHEKAAPLLSLALRADTLCRKADQQLAYWETRLPQLERSGGRQLARQMDDLQQGLLALTPEKGAPFLGLNFFTGEEAPGKVAHSAWAPPEDMSQEALRVLLQQLRLNVRSHEARVLGFLQEQASPVILRCMEGPFAMVTQNSTTLSPGEKLEIAAGVGTAQTRPAPEIRIGGCAIAIGPEGLAQAALKVPGEPGRYSVPVRISFIDQDGKKLVVTKRVEYRVVAPAPRQQ